MSAFPSIQFEVSVSIGGGIPSSTSDVRLEDVVISQPHRQLSSMVQYDFGKTGEGGKSPRTGSPNCPPSLLLTALSSLKADQFRDRSDITKHLGNFDQLPDFTRQSAGADVLFQAAYSMLVGHLALVAIKEE